ncbi:MAG: YezD family protein [Sphingomonas sp.]
MTLTNRRIALAPAAPDEDAVAAAIREALQRLRYGAIALTVHDGRVVQMEITEKRRFDA